MDSMPFCIGLIFILTWTKACVRQACVADYPTGVTTWMQLSWLWCQKKKTEYQPVWQSVATTVLVFKGDANSNAMLYFRL